MFIMRIAQLLKFVNDVLVAVQIDMAGTHLAHNAPAQNNALAIVLMEVPKEHSFVLGRNVFANFQTQDPVRLFQSQGEGEVKKVDKAVRVVANVSSPRQKYGIDALGFD